MEYTISLFEAMIIEGYFDQGHERLMMLYIVMNDSSTSRHCARKLCLGQAYFKRYRSQLFLLKPRNRSAWIAS
jgi:hypothetical protein